MRPSRIKRREQNEEQRKTARKESLKTRFKKWQEERKLKKQGYTNKSRAEYLGRHRRVDQTLNRIILILLLMHLIVWLIVLFI